MSPIRCFLLKEELDLTAVGYYWKSKKTIHLLCCVCGGWDIFKKRGIKTNEISKAAGYFVKDTMYIIPTWHLACIQLFKLTPQLYINRIK